MRPRQDTKEIEGKKFWKLTAIKELRRDLNRQCYWLFQCDCGNRHTCLLSNVKRGNTKSCGCSISTRPTKKSKHGHSAEGKVSPTYISWVSMKQRCNSPKHVAYSRYGGRGIKVCDRWFLFENFLLDMGERPDGTSLDRVDNEKGYFRKNCRWASPAVQANNRSKSNK